MALWPAKKDQKDDNVKIEIPGLPDAAAGEDAGAAVARQDDSPNQLAQLSARLDQLANLLGQANRQLLGYLVDRESKASAPAANDRAAAALAEKIEGLTEKLGQLEAQLKSPGGKAPDDRLQDSPTPALAEFCNGVNRQLARLTDTVRQLQARLDTGLEDLADRLAPEQPPAPELPVVPLPAPVPGPVIGPPAGPTEGDGPFSSERADWQRALLGGELADDPGLGFQRQQLLAGVLQGDAGACTLLGQLLIFRSARTDKMSPLLKDIGEAYYRWQPKNHPGSDPMEKALAAWLEETMQDAGIANTIELVEPGERFDSTRHTASSRGVEITEVRGWVVLRDNGKVYTKANVAVR